MELPINLRVQKAKNEIRYAVNVAAIKYNLPGCVISMILDSVRADDLEEQLAFMSEQAKEINDGENRQDNTTN